MTRQTVLLVYGGESEGREASIRSARSVYAAMDGEKYETLLCYVDPHGKWWLLERWSDTLEEHGGTQLIAALGSRSFLELPGYAIVHPDVIFPLLANDKENERVMLLAQLLNLAVVAYPRDAGFFARHIEQWISLGKTDIAYDSGTDTPDDIIVVAVMGTAKEPQVSTVAYSTSESDDESLRSVADEKLAKSAAEMSARLFESLRCRGYAVIELHRRDGVISLGRVTMMPDLSSTGVFLKLWRMSGVHYPTVVDTLIATARK